MTVAIQELIKRYYAAYDNHDMDTFLSLLTDDVVHDINQGTREVGKPAFKKFMEEVFKISDEKVKNLEIMTNGAGNRVAAEFTVEGTYSVPVPSMPELPPAQGQKYRLLVGSFFEIKDGKISRVTVYYNFQDWLRQVG